MMKKGPHHTILSLLLMSPASLLVSARRERETDRKNNSIPFDALIGSIKSLFHIMCMLTITNL